MGRVEALNWTSVCAVINKTQLDGLFANTRTADTPSYYGNLQEAMARTLVDKASALVLDSNIAVGVDIFKALLEEVFTARNQIQNCHASKGDSGRDKREAFMRSTFRGPLAQDGGVIGPTSIEKIIELANNEAKKTAAYADYSKETKGQRGERRASIIKGIQQAGNLYLLVIKKAESAGLQTTS